VSEMLVLAPWMASSLPDAWRYTVPTMSKAKEALLEIPLTSYIPKFNRIEVPVIPVKKLAHGLLNLFAESGQKNQNTQSQVSPIESVDVAVIGTKKTTLFDNTKTLVVQATKYLVEASKKNQLPHQISAEEFNTTAMDIVAFLEQLVTQAGRQAKKASLEILAFSEQAQANTNPSSSSMPEGKSVDIFRLTQGALRFMDPHSFFKDSLLYSQSVAKLSEMVARGVTKETSVVQAKKKGLSF
jgi:hypothetical protein